jgi:hypothetical protein
VSPATKHAAVFINGATAAAGSTATCTPPSAGTGTGCTIAWSATLTVPGSYLFAVETDTGTNAPANTVLSEGANTYALVAGTGNALAALSLNGVVQDASFGVGTCTTSSCIGTLTLAAAAGNIISFAGTTLVPTAGNNPSSGNIFDNGSVTFVSSAAGIGLVTGSAYMSDANVYASYASNTLTVSGAQATTFGTYPYQVTCAGGATGTFGITAAIVGTASGDVSAGELSGLTTPVFYPAATITVLGTAPTFTCTSGTIGSTTGTVPVN